MRTHTLTLHRMHLFTCVTVLLKATSLQRKTQLSLARCKSHNKLQYKCREQTFSDSVLPLNSVVIYGLIHTRYRENDSHLCKAYKTMLYSITIRSSNTLES